MGQTKILEMLRGGDRRSIGRADRVAAIVGRNSALFSELMGGLWSIDPLVRMRAADAVEKVTRKTPKWLGRYKRELLGLMAETSPEDEQEVCWHLAAMAPRLKLDREERERVICFLNGYLEGKSSILRTFALQALADLARHDAALRSRVVEILRDAARKGTPAMKARSRRLLEELGSLRRGREPWTLR